MKRAIRCLLVIAQITIFFSCQNYDNKIYEKGVSKELAELRKKQIKNLSYEINFVIPLSLDEKVLGNENISFYYTNVDNSPVLIDFRNPKEYVKSIRLNGEKIKLDFYNEHIIIKSRKLKQGKNNLSIEFTAGNRALNRNQEYLYTLFVPDRACTAFPCFDQPSLKAKYKTSITTPKEWTAVANSKLLKKSLQDSNNLFEFDYTQPISTYLYSFVVGKFKHITKSYDDLSITMYHREDNEEKLNNNIEKIFELKYNSLKWLEEYTNIKYPFDKMDFIIIPSFQYSGMEHPGAVLYRDSKMFLDKSSTIRDELNRANLIAHETAHMWFGDLVTMDWFSEVWLKEVFANFIAGKIVNPQYPEINHDLNFLISHYPSSYKIDRSKGANPIEQELDNMKNAGTLYGSIIYHKAPIVMNQLEIIIGNDKLQEGIQEYLAKYSYSNATWDNLISILDTKTNNNLKNWSKSWVYEPHMPNYNIEIAQDANQNFTSIIFEQLDPANKGRNWSQNVTLLANDTKYYTSLRDTFNVVDLNSPHKSINYILPNSDGLAYGYFKLDKVFTEKIMLMLNSAKDPLLRCSIYITLWENMLNSNIKPIDLYHSFYKSITVEHNAQNINLLLNYINKLYWTFLNKTERENVGAKLEEILWKEISLRKSSGIKSSLFNSYISIATNQEHLTILRQIFAGNLTIKGLTLSENDYTKLALTLMIKDETIASDVFDKQLSRITDIEKQNRFKFISEAITSPDIFFEKLKDEKNREKEPWVIDALHYLHHPLKAKESVKYIYPSLTILEELQITGDIFFPKRWLDAIFNGHSTIDAVIEINLFLNDFPNYPDNLKNKIYQSTDLVYRASIIRNE